ncbi:hypothetical protein [Variovorax sp. YR216]|uniref:hypothetical protein n=1 Tax=Variovorax sp. YR216 TaxID=1882828 RepID=UPI00089C0FE4|nr:hypothetical protein [Variovorax sp. YR216]SEA98870.1 hypothetical protein SAMN05444680_10550 [Variovorax sp. YR216]
MNPRDLLFAISMLLVMIGMARTGAAFGDDQVGPTRSEVEVNPIGKGVPPKNLASSALSHREFGRDGTVAASRTAMAEVAFQ